MTETILSFTKDLLESNRIPVHIITLPCDDVPWLDCGLRSDILHENTPDHIYKYLNDFKANTICHLKDTFQCSYSLLRIPDSDALMVCGPVLFEEIRASRLNDIAARIQLPRICTQSCKAITCVSHPFLHRQSTTAFF